ncbi:MAG: TonB-dependent receptor [Methylococcaceae bacterium]|nr:TonB-dependent receptor [Methylococcaceae bacterium]
MVGSLAAQPAAADNTAQAKRTQQTFHISGGTLSHALSQFAGSAGIVLSADARLTDGKASRGLNGQFTVAEGLSALLAGSDLTYQYTANGSVLVAQAPKPVENLNQAEPTELPAVKVTGEAVYAEDKDKNEENDPYNKNYNTKNAVAATKTNTPIFDTPVSIQVISKAVIEDQKSSRIKDALENVSGVRTQPTLGMGTGIITRGFRNILTYRNGLIASGTGLLQSEFDTSNLESIDVLKGPASMLYGRIEPGGLVNLTTKKPLDTPYYSVEQQIGSYDFYRTQWDATGPLKNDGTLLYRFTGAYQNNNSFRDFISNDRVNIAPTITWKPSDATDMTLNIEYMNQDFQADLGIPSIGKRPAPIPISRNYSSDPNDPLDNQSKVYVGTEFNHRFNKDWAIHSRFLANFEHADQIFINPAPARTPYQADGHTMNRNIFYQSTENESYHTNLDLTGKFDIGSTKHQTLIGFDYFQGRSDYGVFGNFLTANPDLAFDIFNPKYGINPALFQAAYNTIELKGTNLRISEDEWYGTYFQDQITLWDKLHIMGGGRYDWASTGAIQTDSINPSGASQIPYRKDEGFSPRVGILYQPIKELGVYGNWTTSFGANNAPATNGITFNPQIGEQFEAGIKTQLFDDRFLATLAYYHITKDNILVNNLNTPDPFDKIANLQRSQGIELDMTGRITNNFSMIGSYAFTDARIIKDFSTGTQGNRINNIPEHSGSLWLKYDLNGYESTKGLSFGVGGVAAGQREGDNANSFQMPGYVRLDAYAAYKWNVQKSRVTAQFNIRNILDKDYYESSDVGNTAPKNGIYPGAPLTAIGSIKVEF